MRILDHLPGTGWRKSSYSGGNEGGSNCVEVASRGGLVGVRDSRRPDGGGVVFSAAQWRAFICTVQAGGL